MILFVLRRSEGGLIYGAAAWSRGASPAGVCVRARMCVFAYCTRQLDECDPFEATQPRLAAGSAVIDGL